MPGAERTRSLACKMEESTHASHDRYAETFRHSLRDGVTAYTRSPRCTGLVSHRRSEHRLKSLIPASGDQDHTISPSARLARRREATASIASRPTSRDDCRTPLLAGRDGGRVQVIWGGSQAILRKSEINFRKSEYVGRPPSCEEPTGRANARPMTAPRRSNPLLRMKPDGLLPPSLVELRRTSRFARNDDGTSIKAGRPALMYVKPSEVSASNQALIRALGGERHAWCKMADDCRSCRWSGRCGPG